MIRSRVILATIEAAAMDKDLPSPLTTACAGSCRPRGIRLPSISAMSGGVASPAIARSIARCEARRMLSLSISSTEAWAMETSAMPRIASCSTARRLAVRRLESFRPSGMREMSSTTAAAVTGPARGPRPTSSTPATRRWPAAWAAVSRVKSGRVLMALHATAPRKMQKGRAEAPFPSDCFGFLTARVGSASVAHALEAAGAIDRTPAAIADQAGLGQHDAVAGTLVLAVTVIAVALWLMDIPMRNDPGMIVAVLRDMGFVALVMRLGVAVAVDLATVVVAGIGHGGADDGQRRDTGDDLGGVIVGASGCRGEAGHRQRGGEDGGDEMTVQHGGFLSGCRRRLAVGKSADPFMTQGWANLPRTGNNSGLLSDNRPARRGFGALDIE